MKQYKEMKIITSKRKLLEARLNDLMVTLHRDNNVSIKDYYKCLKSIDNIRKIIFT